MLKPPDVFSSKNDLILSVTPVYHVELIQVFSAKVAEREHKVGEGCHYGKIGSLQTWRDTLDNPSQHGDHGNLTQGRFEGLVDQGNESCIHDAPVQSRCPFMQAKIESHNRQAEQPPDNRQEAYHTDDGFLSHEPAEEEHAEQGKSAVDERQV